MNNKIHQMLSKAFQSFQNRNFHEAEDLFIHVLKCQPKNFNALHILGVIKGINNLHTDALEYFYKALEVDPNNSQLHLNIAKAFFSLNENQKAAEHYISSLELNPIQPEAWLDYGKTLLILGKIKDALHTIEKAIYYNHNYTEAWFIRGVLLSDLKSYQESLISFNKALEIDPISSKAWYNRGNTLLDLNRLDQALASYNKAISINPSYAEAWANRGIIFDELKNYEQSLASYDKAISIMPEFAEAWVNRGNTLQELENYEQSLASYDKAISINPELAEAWANRGNILHILRQYDESLACYEKAISINSEYAEAWSDRGNLLSDMGLGVLAEASHRNAISCNPNYLYAYSNLLFILNYRESQNPNAALSEANIYGSIVSKMSMPKFNNWNFEFQSKKLKIGFVSADLRNHPVGYFIEGLIECLDASQFELYAFPSASFKDELTDRIRPFFTDWTPIYGVSDLNAATLIYDKKIHVLIDLSGHTANNRLPVFSYRPSPVQVSYLGYFATTGLPEMDYFLGDIHMFPDSDAMYFTENVWKLPETWLCLKPPNFQLPISVLPAQSNGFVTFGSFSNLSKMNDRVVATWASVLNKMPSSKLLIKSKQLGDAAYIEVIKKRFENCGVNNERLILEGSDSREAYLKAYNRVDLVLDTFPYPGGTTSVDALWMGVPVLTINGDRFLSNLGKSIAINAGNSYWIAKDLGEYVQKAVEISSDLKRLEEVRKTLRERVLKSPLFDCDRFAKNFGEALWGMWFQSIKVKKSQIKYN